MARDGGGERKNFLILDFRFASSGDQRLCLFRTDWSGADEALNGEGVAGEAVRAREILILDFRSSMGG